MLDTWQIATIDSGVCFNVPHYSNRRQIEQLAKTSSIPIRIVDRRRAYIPTKNYNMTADPAGTHALQGILARYRFRRFSRQPKALIRIDLSDLVSCVRGAFNVRLRDE